MQSFIAQILKTILLNHFYMYINIMSHRISSLDKLMKAFKIFKNIKDTYMRRTSLTEKCSNALLDYSRTYMADWSKAPELETINLRLCPLTELGLIWTSFYKRTYDL